MSIAKSDMSLIHVDIDSALRSIENVASNQEDISAEESIILRGSVYALLVFSLPS